MSFPDKINDVITTRLGFAINWARSNSMWPMPFGTACCGIEMMATFMSKYDASRFGSEVLKFSPRQSDLLIVSGRISLKMMPVLQRIWEQMPEPKWCISMGACASSGGVFDTYTLIQGVDQFIPVDAYMPGCPPRPEAFIEALMTVQAKARKGEASSDAFVSDDVSRDASSSPLYRSPDAFMDGPGNPAVPATPAETHDATPHPEAVSGASSTPRVPAGGHS